MAPGTATLALRKRLNIVRSLKEMLDLVTLLFTSEEKRIHSGENTYPSYYEEEKSVKNCLVYKDFVKSVSWSLPE